MDITKSKIHLIILSALANTVGENPQADLLCGFEIDDQLDLSGCSMKTF